MAEDFGKLIMNPIRQRIVQYLLLHERGTTGEMRKELSDVPTASLYRHIKTLYEAGCLEVAEERKVRGTVERVYRLAENPLGEVSNEQVSALIQSSMLSLMATFRKYFEGEDPQPQRDLLSLSTSTLLLTDEEFMDMLQRMGEIFNGVIYNKPAEGRKPRRLTIISSPCEDA